MVSRLISRGSDHKLGSMLRWLPAILVAAAITIGSSMTARDLSQSPIVIHDKVAHAIEYAVLSGSILFALAPAGYPAPGSRVLIAALLAAVFGVSDEWHQASVPGRDSSLADLGADAIGALVGASATWLAGRWGWSR